MCVCVCRLLADADGIEVLAQLLTDSMAECRQFSAESITSMATDGESHIFNQPGTSLILPPPPHPPLPYTHTESYRCHFETAGAVNSLVPCLNFADSSVQASSVEALGMLCCNASARQQVLNAWNRY